MSQNEPFIMPLRVLSDALPMQVTNTRERGIGRFTKQALGALLQQPAAGQFHIIGLNAALPRPKPFSLNTLTPHLSYFGDYPLADFRADQWRISLRRHERYWHQQIGRFAAKIFHIHHLFEWQTPPHGQYPEAAVVATVYDLIPLKFPQFYLEPAPAWLRLRYEHDCERLRNIDHLIVISECTRQDIIRLLGIAGERITVASPGPTILPIVNSNPKLEAVLRQRLKLGGKFILCNSGYDPRKNLMRLLEAYALLEWSLRNTYALVLVCRLDRTQANEMWAKARTLRIDEQLVVTNFLSDEELAILYQQATVQFFPSLYEGFGFPVLDSFAVGLPVITSRVSAMAEVAGDAAVLVDPTNSKDMSEALSRVLTDGAFRQLLSERGRARAAEYSWDRAATRIREAYDQCVRDHH